MTYSTSQIAVYTINLSGKDLNNNNLFASFTLNNDGETSSGITDDVMIAFAKSLADGMSAYGLTITGENPGIIIIKNVSYITETQFDGTVNPMVFD